MEKRKLKVGNIYQCKKGKIITNCCKNGVGEGEDEAIKNKTSENSGAERRNEERQNTKRASKVREITKHL